MGKRIAIVQSSYIPWKGYFDLIRSVDEFVLYDDMQFTRRDWRSRNRIKTANGLQWLSVPVEVRGKFHQRICDTRVAEPDWHRTHWRSLQHAYARTTHFDRYRDAIEAAYASLADEPSLSAINRRLIEVICSLLGIHTPLAWSMEIPQREGKSERLLSLCEALGADEYLSGPAARDYLDEALFAKAGVRVVFADYQGYPEYPQAPGPFEHAVSALDLLFRTGPDAPHYMKRLG
jgi:WbqC-like protein